MDTVTLLSVGATRSDTANRSRQDWREMVLQHNFSSDIFCTARDVAGMNWHTIQTRFGADFENIRATARTN